MSFPTNAASISLPTVTVLADSNLSIVVSEIARNYSRSKQSVVNTSFASQKIHKEQISEGAAADILITARESWIEEMKLQGLIDINSQVKLAGDRLVLIGARNTSVESQGAGRFPAVAIINASVDSEPNFIIGNPEDMMEGVFAKEALRNMGVASDLEAYMLYIKRLEQMFETIEKQQAFGLCFASSILGRDGIKKIDTIPESAHKPIFYYAVVVAGDNMNEARKFLDYLKSADVSKLFKKHGFVVD